MHDRKIITFGATDALLLLTATLWGINFSAIKYANTVFPPLTFIWLRVILSMVTLLVVAFMQQKDWPERRDMLVLIGLGVLGNGLYQLLFVNGVTRTQVADSALIVATAPAFIAVMSHFRGVDRFNTRTLLGIGLSIIGVAIIVFGTTQLPQTRSSSILGVGLVVGAVICWSLFTVALKPYTTRINPIQINALTMLGGGLAMVLITPVALRPVEFLTVPATIWATLFYSSVISMGIAYLFWFRGVRVLGPTRTSVYGNLQPAVAILFAWIFLHETPTLWQGIGAGTIIGGIVLTRS
jgi:drug/metabolite transporter (DMT)-like permease